MEPSERNNQGDLSAPHWETDLRVRRALATALEPDGNAGGTTEAALHRLRAQVSDSEGAVAHPRGNGFPVGTGTFPAARTSSRETARLSGVMGTRLWGTPRTWLGKAIALGAVVGAAILVVVAWSGETRNPGTTRTYRTGADQTVMLTLDEGTRVMLTPHSALRLVDFGPLSRTVNVDAGTAHFAVAASRGAPFIVRSGRTSTRVLGTEFLVRLSEDHKRVHVAVASGRVAVSGSVPGRGVTLSAGYAGDVIDSTVNVGMVTGESGNAEWRDGDLVFRHAPLSTVLAALSHWYGYQFRCADSNLAQQKVTVSVSTQSSESALSTLEHTLEAAVTVVGDTVTLTPHVERPAPRTPRTRSYEVWTPSREVGR